MDWFPVVFIVFKVLVLGIGMFFAIKWHHDQWQKQNGKTELSEVLRAGGKIVLVFVVLLAALLWLTFSFGTSLGLDL